MTDIQADPITEPAIEDLVGISETPETPEVVTPKVFSRDAIRTAILDSKGENILVDAFGVQIEVRTPALEDLLQYRNLEDDETIMGRAIANNCWVPGTEERVFDEADIPALMQVKFTSDMKKLNKAVTSILGDDASIESQVEDNTKSNKK